MLAKGHVIHRTIGDFAGLTKFPLISNMNEASQAGRGYSSLVEHVLSVHEATGSLVPPLSSLASLEATRVGCSFSNLSSLP